MRAVTNKEFPDEVAEIFTRARRLEWFSLAYTTSAAIFLFLVMGGSQAMRTSFFEDAISTLPAISFLVCTKIAQRRASEEFPYGFHGIVSIGYLTASLGLFAMGVFLITEAAIAFFGEPPTLGTRRLFGQDIWEGWVMLVAVAYSAIPAFFFGRAKLKMAPKLHDKILFADAQMMKADWTVELGTAAGVIGLGFGLWWADPLAAVIVSVSVLRDGVTNVRIAVEDLIERRPMRINRSEPSETPEALRRAIKKLDWVDDAQVRLREVGHIFLGEVFIRPTPGPHDFPRLIREAHEYASGLTWRIRDVTVTVLDRLERPDQAHEEGVADSRPARPESADVHTKVRKAAR